MFGATNGAEFFGSPTSCKVSQCSIALPSVELVDVDAGNSRITRVIVEEIQKVHMRPYIVANGDNAVDDDTGLGAFPCDLAEELT